MRGVAVVPAANVQVGGVDRAGLDAEAAAAVFKSRDVSALPALDAALAKESDARIKRALQQARAAIVIFQPSATETEKVQAISIIQDRGDQDARGLLAQLGQLVAQFLQLLL